MTHWFDQLALRLSAETTDSNVLPEPPNDSLLPLTDFFTVTITRRQHLRQLLAATLAMAGFSYLEPQRALADPVADCDRNNATNLAVNATTCASYGALSAIPGLGIPYAVAGIACGVVVAAHYVYYNRVGCPSLANPPAGPPLPPPQTLDGGADGGLKYPPDPSPGPLGCVDSTADADACVACCKFELECACACWGLPWCGCYCATGGVCDYAAC
jgi:hypothetical protein